MTEQHVVSFYGWDDGLYVTCICGWQDYLGDQPMTIEGMQIVADGHKEARRRDLPDAV